MQGRSSGCETPEVYVVLEGSLLRDRKGSILDAHCSVALVVAKDVRLLVDTGAPGDEQRVISALDCLGLSPDDITHIIYTHAHRDHAGCDNLYKGAAVFMHPEEMKAEGSWDDRGAIARASPLAEGPCIASGVSAVHTPGHTPGSISVLINGRYGGAEGRVICSGDALPTRDNYKFRLPPGINYDRALAQRSMERIIALAEWVIPGHDGPIRVSKSG